MNKFLLLLVAGPVTSFCQYPSLHQYKLSGITSTVFEYKGCFLNSDCHEKQEKRITEVPPWVIDGGVRTYFFVDGRQSVLWSSPKSLTTNSTIDLKNYANGPDVATRPYIMERFYSSRVKKYDWRRNYHAIYTAQVLWPKDAGRVVVGFCHSENKNEVSGDCYLGHWTNNTIQANVPIDCNDPNTYSGGKPYRDGWAAYNALLTAVWTPYNEQTAWGQGAFANDLGPIAWPCTGYVTTTGIKATSGLRHPSSILRGDSVYIFFVDGGPFGDNVPEVEGRKGGVKVLRVHKDKVLDAHGYSIYYKDPQGGEHWSPSLPEGFTKEKMLDYVAVKGPKSTTLLNDKGAYYQVIRFSVAKVKEREGYIGVEQYIDFSDRTPDHKPTWKVALRYSADLVNWSDRQLIVYKTHSWEASQMNYPVLLNKEGSSNTEVDANEFYIVGSEHTPADHINKIRVYDPAAGLAVEPAGSPRLLMQSLSTVAVPTTVEVLPFPNPFEGFLNVRMTVPAHSRVRIYLITPEGRRLRRLADATTSNLYKASFNLSSLPPGLYLLECLVEGTYVYKKIVKQ
jgi:hypothetical protein